MKIKCNWTGELIEAIPWNGEHEGIKYPFEGCTEYAGTDGTIYYEARRRLEHLVQCARVKKALNTVKSDCQMANKRADTKAGRKERLK